MKILLLEDDTSLAEMIKLSLDNEKYDVKICNTIGAARSEVESGSYEMLLFDVQINNDKSFGLAKEIIESKEIPIIFISAIDDELSIISALNLGGDDYITKPFSIGILTSRIEAVKRRVSQKKVTQFVSKDIILDTENMKVVVDKDEIVLTVIEFRLLKHLMENSQKVITKDSLAYAGWEDDNFVDDNTVAVNIYRLRKKIEKNNIEYITTVRGLGYIFSEECYKR